MHSLTSQKLPTILASWNRRPCEKDSVWLQEPIPYLLYEVLQDSQGPVCQPQWLHTVLNICSKEASPRSMNRTRNVVYHLVCKTCHINYVGMTTASLHQRMQQHLQKVDEDKCRALSGMSKHWLEKELCQGVEDFFTIEVLQMMEPGAEIICQEDLWIKVKGHPILNVGWSHKPCAAWRIPVWCSQEGPQGVYRKQAEIQGENLQKITKSFKADAPPLLSLH